MFDEEPDDEVMAPHTLLVHATVHYVLPGGESQPVETILMCSPFVGLRLEFFDSDRDLDLVGIVTEVVSRDLDGDLSLHVYTKRP